jgi:hypothetical protein
MWGLILAEIDSKWQEFNDLIIHHFLVLKGHHFFIDNHYLLYYSTITIGMVDLITHENNIQRGLRVEGNVGLGAPLWR